MDAVVTVGSPVVDEEQDCGERIRAIERRAEAAAKAGGVTFSLLLKTQCAALPSHNPDPESRQKLADLTGKLKQLFEDRHGDIHGFQWSDFQVLGAALTSGSYSAATQERTGRTAPSDQEPHVWIANEPRELDGDHISSLEVEELLYEAYDRAGDAKVLPSTEQQYQVKQDFFSAICYVITLADEQTIRSQKNLEPALRPEQRDLAERHVQDATRRMQGTLRHSVKVRYFKGLLRGLGIVGLVAFTFFAVLSLLANQIVGLSLGVSVLAGAIGAVISTLTRLGNETREMNLRTDGALVSQYGLWRSLVGGALGALIFFILIAELAPIDVPSASDARLSFFVVLAFLGGFGERFAAGVGGLPPIEIKASADTEQE